MQVFTCSKGRVLRRPWLNSGQLLKAVNKLPGLSKAEIDEDAILLRAYGKGTDVLIDRESTQVCAKHTPLG
jgi:hypothetical protein